MNLTFGAISVIFVCTDVQAQLLVTACLVSKLTFRNFMRFRTYGAAAARANLNKTKKNSTLLQLMSVHVPSFL